MSADGGRPARLRAVLDDMRRFIAECYGAYETGAGDRVTEWADELADALVAPPPTCDCGSQQVGSRRFGSSYHLKWCSTRRVAPPRIEQTEPPRRHNMTTNSPPSNASKYSPPVGVAVTGIPQSDSFEPASVGALAVPARWRELATWAARKRHQSIATGHPGMFETCPHPDCVLVRAGVSPRVADALVALPRAAQLTDSEEVMSTAKPMQLPDSLEPHGETAVSGSRESGTRGVTHPLQNTSIVAPPLNMTTNSPPSNASKYSPPVGVAATGIPQSNSFEPASVGALAVPAQLRELELIQELVDAAERTFNRAKEYLVRAGVSPRVEPASRYISRDTEPDLPKDECSSPDLLRKVAENLDSGYFQIPNAKISAGPSHWAAALRARADYLENRLAVVSPRVEPEWQPIATAPTDGTALPDPPPQADK